MTAVDWKSFISGLPSLPGVYRMLNAKNEVIYVGKARDLKKRVASYFQKTDHAPRTLLMVAQIESVETTITRSESEALLLENNLIKALNPRYNILYKDDKSYPYIVLTGHQFPRIALHRGRLLEMDDYFGPFAGAGAVRESIQLLQKVFRIRTCEDTVFRTRSKPCLLYQIRRCTGPCVNLISEPAYQNDVESAKLFLKGEEDKVIESLSEQMEQAAKTERYEEAAILRDKIIALRKVQQRQFVSSELTKDADVLACVSNKYGMVCVNLVMIRAGRHVGDKCFFPKNAEQYDCAGALEAFIPQHYLGRVSPNLIIINQTFETDSLEQLLTEQAGRKVRISCRPTGERRVWLKMAEQNAALALERNANQQTAQELRLNTLREALDLPSSVCRIECFDISHTMGEATVASCVVYDKNKMQSGEYRHFNIRDAAPGDDFAAMREVLTRRYRRTVAGETKMPDLILIDGGKGQLNIAVEVLAELGLHTVPVIGVAKGVERKPGEEQLIFPDLRKPLQLPKDSLALHLIQQIRDEAHRFAIFGHRAKRKKARMHSSLEDISGIGAKRRQSLLIRFGGLRGIIAASVDELAQTEGISRTLAEKIYEELH